MTCPEYPAGVRSLLGVLDAQRRLLPDRPVCHRIVQRRTGLTADAMTVEALAQRALAAGATLGAHGVRPGDRVVLSLADPHDFLAAFFGALVAGAAAVPLPTPGEAAPRSFATRVRGVYADCTPALAVVEDAGRFARAVGAGHDAVLLEPRALDGPHDGTLREAPADAPAFIQYTSGSTGAPRGVVVTHDNVLANCRAIRDATAYTRADRMVSWLPLHHDMGLVGGLLTSIYCAAETFLMPPMTFLARPVTWLEAMTRFAATLTVGPTFAYGLCARKIPDKQLAGIDLSALRLAYIGAEPIDPAVVAAFEARYRAYGLSATAVYPVYGLAEATLAVAFPPPGSAVYRDTVDRVRLARDGVAMPVATDHPQAVTFVAVGQPLPRHRVRIVSPETDVPTGERRVGELVVEGASVTPRYFGEDDVPARTVLRTGDLAYEAEGRLYVVDRIKDLVIIAGQNHAPSDIEQVVAEVPGLRRGRIVAFADGTPEALHVVAEASPHAWRPPDEIADDVRRAVRAQIGLAAASVTVVTPGTLERTSSGKMKRRACAEAFRAGTLHVVRTRADVRAHGRSRGLGRVVSAARMVRDWIGG